jgi:hypothetical protein
LHFQWCILEPPFTTWASFISTSKALRPYFFENFLMKSLRSCLYTCIALLGFDFCDCSAQVPGSPEKQNGQSGDSFDYEAELKAILTVEDFEERHILLSLLSKKLGTSDPKRAWNLMAQIPKLPDRLLFLSFFMKIWGKHSPAEALNQTRDLPDGEVRLLATNKALEGWAAKAPLAALQWASENLSNGYRRTAYAQIGEVWVKSEPSVALNWGMKLSNEIERVFYVVEALEIWTELHPMDAAHWAAALPLGKFHDLMVSKVVQIWVQHYPRMAIEWLAAAPEHHWLLPSAASKWAEIDRTAAADWASQLEDKQLCSLCKVSIAAEWAEYSSPSAYAWAEANLDGEHLSNCRRLILGNWAAAYPMEALKWSQKLTSKDSHLAALDIILENWALSDFAACQSWVKQQKDGLEKNIGLCKLANVLTDSEPEAAAELSLAISDSALQKKCIVQLLESWKQSSKEKSEAWIQQHPRILKLLNQ